MLLSAKRKKTLIRYVGTKILAHSIKAAGTILAIKSAPFFALAVGVAGTIGDIAFITNHGSDVLEQYKRSTRIALIGQRDSRGRIIPGVSYGISD